MARRQPTVPMGTAELRAWGIDWTIGSLLAPYRLAHHTIATHPTQPQDSMPDQPGLTITLDAAVSAQLEWLARREGKLAAEIAAAAVADYVALDAEHVVTASDTPACAASGRW